MSWIVRKDRTGMYATEYGHIGGRDSDTWFLSPTKPMAAELARILNAYSKDHPVNFDDEGSLSWKMTKLDHFDGHPTFDPIYQVTYRSHDKDDAVGEFFVRDEKTARTLMYIVEGSGDPRKFHEG